MNLYRATILEAVRAVSITSAISFSWFGRRGGWLPSGMARNLTRDVTRNMMISNLQSRLYRDYYALGQATLRKGHAPDPYSKGTTAYLQGLSEANSGRGYWERGWQVVATGENKVLVGKQGLHLVARPDEYRANGTGVAPGAPVELLFPKELHSISPGYYMAVGDAEGSEDVGGSGDGAEGLVRLYWHVGPEGAVELMRYATGILNEAALPFRLKVLNDPANFTRCDAGILYVSKRHYGQIASLLRSIYEAVTPNVRGGTPALTKRLAPGLGVAEDPQGGESFGLHRCHVLAEGLVRAYERGGRSLPDRLAVVEETFAEHGINLDAPYLNPGSEDGYMPLQGLPAPALHAPLPRTDRDILLLTARQLGEGICDDAIWHEGRCNWVGAQVAALSRSGGHARLVYRTLGPDLYDGTAGVALFLAHLYAQTGDAQVYRTALGAARHALSCLTRPSSRLGQGAYTGWPGVLLAAMRVGALLDESELLEEVARASRSMEPDYGEGHDLDLLSGSAGAIAALLALRDILPDGTILEMVIRLGDDLIERAEAGANGFSWPSPRTRGRRNLTGFSHGAAGIGYALLKLFHATGEWKYREAAEMAFRYERYWFDATERNWPDFREVPGRGQVKKRVQAPCSLLWCHGAPGIALSRLYAYQLLGDDIYREEAVVALSTTEAATRDMLKSRTANYSLCHGLAGNAEIVDIGQAALDRSAARHGDLSLEVAATGVEMYARRDRRWPCGVEGGETPGLMLGLAGIGLFYLRLHDPAIPSVLML